MIPGRTAFPLTEAQEGLWYAQALDRANPIFNCGQYIELRGGLDVARFTRAFDAAVAQSPALRLRFGMEGGAPRQWLAEAGPRLEVVDLANAGDPEAEALARMWADNDRAIDLAEEQASRFALYLLSGDRAFWYERIHHLATDGFGIVLLTNRVGELYSAQETGKPPAPFPALGAVFEEDAAYRASERRAAEAAFWQGEMRGLETVAGPAEGRAVTSTRLDRARAELSQEFRARLMAVSKAARVGWPDVLTVLTAAYFSRVSGTGERVFGLPFMGRMGTKAARVPCMWMNVLPYRCDPDEDTPLPELLQAEARRLGSLRKHGRYRSEQLRRDLRRTAIDARLYGPLINVQPFDMPPRFAGLEAHLHILGAGAVDDITATFRGDAIASLSLEIDSNPALYSKAEARAHLARLEVFLMGALGSERLADVPTLTPQEERWAVHGVNATDHPVPEITLTDLICAQMRATPDAPAVAFGSTTLSYAELDRRSAALASALHARGAGPGKVVATALPRSEHLAVALVAILRAGAAYVPLDPENPPARLGALLERTGAVALLAEADLDAGGMAPFAPEAWPETGEAPEPGTTPDDLAYILFTSGSTGEPKGVMIEHRAIVNRLLWMRDHYGIDTADRILQKTPITFDVSVWELFLPYLCGGTLVFAEPGAHRDPSAIARLVRAQGITTMHFVPSMLSAFLEAPASEGLELTRVFCSGEALTAEHRTRFHARVKAQLHNLYGPTEAAVDVTYWDAAPEDESQPLPIGFPVWNTRVHVLDARMRPVPPGVHGQLYLGGVQLARGYLGRPDLTAERFVPDPFRRGARLYATGDVAFMRPDGAVVYAGRADHQVKIRGMRIEPGEIEGAIRVTGLVRDAVVIARADGGAEPRLVAYVLTGPAFDSAPLLADLATALPAHMVPAAVVALESWPMTSSGKLDRKALPAPVLSMPKGTPPVGPVEERLAALYAEVLHLPQAPGREADFFDLGGDSLTALTLSFRIEAIFGQDPGLGQIFETPGLAQLARALEMADTARAGLAPLLPLAEGQGALLFILHPAGGLGWGYRRLARALTAPRPVFALQSPMLTGAPLPGALRALASDYADRIEAQAPRGMIHLAGWSVGGILAQEVAVELAARGRALGLVAMLDSYPAECWRAEPELTDAEALRALLAIAGHDPDRHPDLDSRAAVVGFLKQGGTPLGSLPDAVLDAVVQLVTGTNRLIRGHHHRRYDGVLTHVRAARDHAGRDLHAGLWAPHAAQVVAIDLPLLHPEMVSQAAAEALGPAFSARMVAAEAGQLTEVLRA
ncbi:non-ribosomal peptide synthetase [Salipiger mangrovisoli]|uniref:Amino acid adenylation domain-containing protein n=1 Tax=Salipiger mangrovisoli TaxID=2865933 RepID=A0ABR9X321_9RHOB|nr:non-ribosomal peptide synthetase [Salipiger mangrovisoli]MBE9637980.1 amino acid adenylation domain-containing protein [Salipiger mangrovisoli]